MPEARDDWADISATSGSYTERRADPEHPLDFFRARSDRGNYILLLKVDDMPEVGNLPALSGLDFRHVRHEDRADELVLELRDAEQFSIFRALVSDVMNATGDMTAGENPSGALRVIHRIDRWQKLLKRRHEKILSRQAIIGLFGELHFMRHRVWPRIGAAAAIACWRGPYGDEQDFAIHGWIIETKAQLSTADQVLKISSEAQLDTDSGPIVLCHQSFASSPSASGDAISLNDLVDRVRTDLASEAPGSLDLFEAGLVNAEYDHRPEYDQECWEPVTLSIFEIEDGFPRLVPSSMASGIRRVSYQIVPAACADFRREPGWLDREVLGA